jgi:putative transposase
MRRWFIESLDRARQRHAFDLWAYVIMPEHVHIVLWPRARRYSVSKILSAIKLSVSKRAIAYLERESPKSLNALADRQPNGKTHYRIWQRGGGYDRNLMEPTTLWAEIDYVHANPVRRGLVDRPTDWLWSSAAEYEQRGSGPLSLDLDSLPRTPLG